jgi:hypothetical protein
MAITVLTLLGVIYIHINCKKFIYLKILYAFVLDLWLGRDNMA